MGILIGVEQVSFEWPGKVVLNNQTVGIQEGDRIGVVGTNGGGKSTLLALIAHEIEPDSGSVTWRNNISVGVLGQKDNLVDTATVERAVVGDAEQFEWASDAQKRAIISELLEGIDWHALVGELSGGQRRRVDLARLLLNTYDVVLLDEPTNHLDMHAITWLAEHLQHLWAAQQGALVVITHDRWFLDTVCDHMWEVHDAQIEPFEGGYSAYIQQRAERERLAQVQEERRQSILRKELNWLAHGPKARTSKPKFRLEAAYALIENDPPLRNELELKRLAMSRLGKKVIDFEDVSFHYPEGQTVIDYLSWRIGPGERLGILGANGAGKSTLLGLMQGSLQPSSGVVRIGQTVKFGVMNQQLDALAPFEDWRVLELISRYKTQYFVDGQWLSPTQMLERLGFNKRELPNFIKDLSGGQRRRLAFLLVLLEEPNVLILDEPGNDLDTDMLALMEDVLDSWPGTLIMVSHDRYLMERVCDNLYVMDAGHVTHEPGGVDAYLKAYERAQTNSTSTHTAFLVQKDEAGEKNQNDSPKMSGQERRELKKRFDAISRKLEKTKDEPAHIEEKMQAADPSDYAELTRLQDELTEVRAEREALEDEWLELADILGEA